MIQKITADKRHFTDFGWLKTFWLFSFSDYYDPKNIGHGMMRVFNDDIVEPHSGFPTHPHEEMEIISIILKGEMFHKDTMGNETIIRSNDVQRMTAGTGLYHSEENISDDPVHFFQIWIRPDKKGLSPSYDQKTFNPEQWNNTLTLLASSRDADQAVRLNSEASIYRAELDVNNPITYSTVTGRNLFVYVIDGDLKVNEQSFAKKDQARITGLEKISISTTERADFILIDIPEDAELRT